MYDYIYIYMIIYVCALYIYICHGQNMVVVCSTGSSIHNGNRCFLMGWNQSLSVLGWPSPKSWGSIMVFVSQLSWHQCSCLMLLPWYPNQIRMTKITDLGNIQNRAPLYQLGKTHKKPSHPTFEYRTAHQKSSKTQFIGRSHWKIPWDFLTFSIHPFPKNRPSFLVSSCILPMISPSHGHPGLTLWKPPQVIHVHGLF